MNVDSSSEYLLEARNIVKVFGELRANDDVTLSLKPGEIHALLGENGAGKSTLVKIIYGSLQATSGQLFWKGQPVTVANPAAARELGIGMVFQHFSLFDALTVTENIALALPADVDIGALAGRIEKVSNDYGLPLRPDALVADLSVGERQRIEIVRCLLQEPRLLIMDEPTAVLTPQEADQLFVTLERLASEGCGVLYISHRLEEVKRICHDATILRHGKLVARVDPQQETAASLANLMVGAEVAAVKADRGGVPGSPLLELVDLSLPTNDPFGVALKNINLTIRAGEIVAVAGVAGNGQSEFFDAVSGEQPSANNETVKMSGEACGRENITRRRRRHAAFVPEERIGHGAVPDFPLSENVVLTHHAVGEGVVRKGLINRAAARDVNSAVTELFDVRKGTPDPEARSLSGGNLQKFVVGREMTREPKILVVNQPTWGVDAGAAALIRQALIDLARSGSAVLVISQDLDEIFEISDRIAVISRGEMSEAYPAEELSLEQIGLLMAGAHEKAPEKAAAS
ncbi:MAG: ABC transporter ATP-binding protein [Rhodospirillaceae bacterium]|jgi:general nucleoside transport system ATP-binding protein|nr:ABC transporter ATP-binding protein [Rhodospirillaceae bacterium]MBT4488425.1 ABC transporter ATP-binding protein [Rhodospirillaceae bacterium]MBT5194215.1 ABC transporter ATP-binding protein [Rhodospirillaceae bacterium]MBT5894274.1 ABC transporter ATP-binding protein [Rhodospirillaceae bacterium]MBT6427068.1 ABC transporter ATP-binding protein [Rhodospirillaceae bacterium]